MKRYYIDRANVINLDGIRYVQLNEGTYRPGEFSFIVAYKGDKINVIFKSRDERDMAFANICSELEKRRNNQK